MNMIGRPQTRSIGRVPPLSKGRLGGVGAKHHWQIPIFPLDFAGFDLVCHRRQPPKRDVLMREVYERVRAHNRKAEVAGMKQTIAEALIAEGKELASIEVAIKTKQEVLMTLLQTKFGQLPNHISERIQNVSEIERLNILNRFVTANSLVQRGGNHSLVNASSSDPSRPPSVLVRSIGLRESPRPTRGGD
jgi:hypothetical protein